LLIDKPFPNIGVNLRWDAEFTKPFWKNGLRHSFSYLVLHRRDHRLFGEGVRDVCGCADIQLQALGQTGQVESGCWACPELVEVAEVVACLWKVSFVGKENMF
jgi:hypothetical protein